MHIINSVQQDLHLLDRVIITGAVANYHAYRYYTTILFPTHRSVMVAKLNRGIQLMQVCCATNPFCHDNVCYIASLNMYNSADNVSLIIVGGPSTKGLI